MENQETSESPTRLAPLFPSDQKSTASEASSAEASSSHFPSGVVSPSGLTAAGPPLFFSSAVHENSLSHSRLTPLSDGGGRGTARGIQEPQRSASPSLRLPGARPQAPESPASRHSPGALQLSPGSPRRQATSAPSPSVSHGSGLSTQRRPPRQSARPGTEQRQQLSPGEATSPATWRSGNRGGKEDALRQASPSQARASSASRVSPRIVGVYAASVTNATGGANAKKRGLKLSEDGGAFGDETRIPQAESGRQRLDREGAATEGDVEPRTTGDAHPRAARPALGLATSSGDGKSPRGSRVCTAGKTGGERGEEDCERVEESQDAPRATPGADSGPSYKAGAIRQQPGSPETFQLMPVVGDRAIATGARKRKKKKSAFRRRSADGGERPEKPPVGKGGSLFLHPALGDDSEEHSRPGEDEGHPTSALCSTECCGLFWRRRWHAMKGGFWGWGFTNRPREGPRYYLSEIFAALIIALTQVPEAASFAMMANLPPAIGVHSAWLIGLFACGLGGRPGMINGVTGSFAATIAAYVTRRCAESACTYEGVETLVASVFLAGLILMIFAYSRLACLVQLIPASVTIGFCNGIAIIIFLAQLQIFKDPSTGAYITGNRAAWMAGECCLAAVIMEGWKKVPFVGKLLPGSLISMVAAGLVEFLVARPLFDTKTPTIGEVAELTANSALPSPFFAQSHLDFKSNVQVHRAIMQGVMLAVVAILETLMTVEVVDIYAAQAALPPEPPAACSGKREALLGRLLPRLKGPSQPPQTPAEAGYPGVFSPASSGDKFGLYNGVASAGGREAGEEEEGAEGRCPNAKLRGSSSREFGENRDCDGMSSGGFDTKQLRRGVSSENTSRGSASLSPRASPRTERDSLQEERETKRIQMPAELPSRKAERVRGGADGPKDGRKSPELSSGASSPSRQLFLHGENSEMQSELRSGRVSSCSSRSFSGPHAVSVQARRGGEETTVEEKSEVFSREAFAVRVDREAGAGRRDASDMGLRAGSMATRAGSMATRAGGTQEHSALLWENPNREDDERTDVASGLGELESRRANRGEEGLDEAEGEKERRKPAVKGDGDQQIWAAGVANIVCAFFGGMGGGAMIGLSVMNLRSGGKGKESGFLHAVFVFVLIAGAYKVLNFLPIAALAGIMFCVAFHTFKWFSLPMVVASFLPETLRWKHPCLVQKITRADAIIVVIVTLCCKFLNVALAAGIGIFIAALVFAWEANRRFCVEAAEDEKRQIKYYEVQGPLCFSTAHKFESAFNYDEDPPTVMCMLSGSTRLFDYSAMASMNAVSRGYLRRGKTLHFKGMSHGCLNMMAKANHLMQHMDYELIELEVPPIHNLVEVHPDDDRESALAESLFAPSHAASRTSFSRKQGQAAFASRAVDSLPRHTSSSLSRVLTGSGQQQPSADVSEGRSEKRWVLERQETPVCVPDDASQKCVFKRQGESEASKRTACETTAGASLSFSLFVGGPGDLQAHDEETESAPGGERGRRSNARRVD
ncbi:inorganic anion transporter, sulfate permease (SulP) family protein [Toxoplasma gondii ME49]|uniref:Inorganic anion transporter, sulfate permease (SulP) family protein n=5 Tax=Toxoplasma gondii TaxID=5811 RepID=A0A0F7UYE8_TOXGV|nr:inorganic anion transporter, sulfate permease (SulP) family protein [Toxoplasma gondii ME49]EPT28750.1 inorganic anion transporter, sulfate permease (SulP) family protein [Toxoplasma gondii ME49]ESS35895.1 inorganic anion transporter, sulfate permease (SulP) family protein [Toxoplasma gondii VEG]CEL75021.1 TPA: sulfate transporter, putative [Toxoplasma gondii VEG]|eukprot:XP_018636773.1 inorganic anion transporter, sulfate permease (SulP) family protein [Toxoplasma gondii ME49]